jgi:hypothetical protein
MQRVIGFVLLAVGIVLLILGISAADSLASEVSEFFTGNPTDRSVWLMIGGVAGIIAGGVLAGLPGKALKRS